jgi:phosphoglycerate dehydrogenase-like enzyme
MNKYKTLFITHRAPVHQKVALDAAPLSLEVDIRRSPSREEVLDLITEAEFLISERSSEIDAEIIRAGKKLRLIQRLGSQVHDIDLEAARQAGIKVCFMPVYTAVTVAEHVLMQLLTLAKRSREMMEICLQAEDWGLESKRSDENTFVVNWSQRKAIRTLYHSTVGILGFGEIGTELARRLQNFDGNVLYNKRSRLPEEAEKQLRIRYAELDELLAESDYVCSLLPFSPETEKSIGSTFVARMKPGSCLVHSGASGVLAEQELTEALRSGQLFGLATDGFEWEPIRPDSPLLEVARQPFANILLTPHSAVADIDLTVNRREEDYKNIMNFLENKSLMYQIV